MNQESPHAGIEIEAEGFDVFDVSRKRNGHTLRRNMNRFWKFNYSKNIDVVISGNTVSNSRNEKFIEYPVTPVDDHFRKTLLGGKLNSRDRWEYVLEKLEGLNISKRKKYGKYGPSTSVIYEVPIIGHLLISKDGTEMNSKESVSRKNRNWLYWNGTFYDPDYVYEHPKNNDFMKKLKIVCPRKAPFPTFDDDKIIEFPLHCRYQHSKYHPRKMRVSINHKFHNISGAGWKQTGEQRHLDVDLGSHRLVTHFGIAGMFPVTVKFPESSQDTEKRCYDAKKSTRNLKVKRRVQFVELVDESNLDHASYLTSFRLSRFDAVSRTWIVIGVYDGNTDATTENIISLIQHDMSSGIFTRLLRVTPAGCHNQPICRVAVYGRRNDISLTPTADEPETVKYVVEQPSLAPKIPESKYCRNGKKYSYLYRSSGKVYRNSKMNGEDDIIDNGFYRRHDADYVNQRPIPPTNVYCSSIRVSPITVPTMTQERNRRNDLSSSNEFCLSNVVWPSLTPRQGLDTCTSSTARESSEVGYSASIQDIDQLEDEDLNEFDWVDDNSSDWEWELL